MVLSSLTMRSATAMQLRKSRHQLRLI